MHLIAGRAAATGRRLGCITYISCYFSMVCALSVPEQEGVSTKLTGGWAKYSSEVACFCWPQTQIPRWPFVHAFLQQIFTRASSAWTLGSALGMLGWWGPVKFLNTQQGAVYQEVGSPWRWWREVTHQKGHLVGSFNVFRLSLKLSKKSG